MSSTGFLLICFIPLPPFNFRLSQDHWCVKMIMHPLCSLKWMLWKNLLVTKIICFFFGFVGVETFIHLCGFFMWWLRFEWELCSCLYYKQPHHHRKMRTNYLTSHKILKCTKLIIKAHSFSLPAHFRKAHFVINFMRNKKTKDLWNEENKDLCRKRRKLIKTCDLREESEMERALNLKVALSKLMLHETE